MGVLWLITLHIVDSLAEWLDHGLLQVSFPARVREYSMLYLILVAFML